MISLYVISPLPVDSYPLPHSPDAHDLFLVIIDLYPAAEDVGATDAAPLTIGCFD